MFNLNFPVILVYPSKAENQTEAEITVDDSGVRCVHFSSLYKSSRVPCQRDLLLRNLVFYQRKSYPPEREILAL